VPVDVHLILTRPNAVVALTGDLDSHAAAILAEAVESARIAGCRRIHLDLEGAQADESFIASLGQLRRSCARAGGSFEVHGLAEAARKSPSTGVEPAVGHQQS
jgi:anti-anti-sigma regulatory factor